MVLEQNSQRIIEFQLNTILQLTPNNIFLFVLRHDGHQIWTYATRAMLHLPRDMNGTIRWVLFINLDLFTSIVSEAFDHSV